MQRSVPARASRCLDSMILEALEKIVADEDLTRAEAEAAMEDILAGRASDALIAGLLTALRIKGETVDEVVGFAKAMRRHATPIFPAGRVEKNDVLVDTAGTGGDAAGHIQYLNRCFVCDRGRRCARCETWQSLG